MSTKESCTCQDKSIATLLGSWQKIAQAELAEGCRNGCAIKSEFLKETVEMIRSLSLGAARAFLPSSYRFRHHLPDCPFDRLGVKDSLCLHP